MPGRHRPNVILSLPFSLSVTNTVVAVGAPDSRRQALAMHPGTGMSSPGS